MAQSSVAPHRTPSRLPSRHSTQIITPARSSHPNYVRPSDSQRSIAQTSRTRKKGKSLNTESEADSVVQSQPNQSSSQNRTRKPPPTSQKKSQRKRKKTPITNDSDNNSENADRIMDYTQDSDEENSKIRRSNKKKINTFDPIRDYFKAPFHANETDTGEELMYQCKWCGVVYKKGCGTNSNLYKHREGTLQRAHCSGRSEAIKAGCKLPLSKKDIQDKDDARNQGLVKHSLKNATFDNKVLNQLLVIWLI
ncbi:hypothetical protein PTTG_26285 [Puccinia triticina 1-1 BBBD Race 1]|uniref:Uncharacterized protein n=1 Tax=Puccinia triticina (isolate 1-1 / race 1 (BBBD)) TaxID=630390 RepID=A0A180GXB8_PUCT1|nr:hypothetical protein PTTG_26285 [Puccinia triticina 1-1 BBBD Race 1]